MAGHPQSTASIRERDSDEESLALQEQSAAASQTAKAKATIGRLVVALGRISLSLSSAYGVKLHCGRWTGRQWQVALCHHSFEHVRARRQSQIGVDQVERVSLGFRQRYEFEAPGPIQRQQLRKHFSVKRADVHEEHIRNITAVQCVREVAIKGDALVRRLEVTVFESRNRRAIALCLATGIWFVP